MHNFIIENIPNEEFKTDEKTEMFNNKNFGNMMGNSGLFISNNNLILGETYDIYINEKLYNSITIQDIHNIMTK